MGWRPSCVMSATSTPASRPGRVVVGVDGSASSRGALEWACAEARRADRPLLLLHAHVVPITYAGVGSFVTLLESDVTAIQSAAQQTLAAAVATAHTLSPETRISSQSVEGSAAAALVEASVEAYAVVTGARGRGPLGAAVLGSVSTQVAMHAHCPVVVVKDVGVDDVERRKGVVVGFDGSGHSQACLAFAFEQADARGTSLDVVNAWPLERGHGSASAVDAVSALREIGPAHELFVDEALAGWAQRYPDVDLERSVVHSHAVPALLEHSRSAELLVVGSRGRGGFTSLVLGSVSHAVLQGAGCPVAVVRGLP